MIHKIFLTGLLLLLLTVNVSQSSEPLRIGLTLGLTGQYEVMSKKIEQGLRLWENHVNQKDGILNRPVKIIIHDDKSDPIIAAKLYSDMIEKDKLDFLLGPYSSPIALKILPITEKHKYPLLIPSTPNNLIWQQGYRYVFGVVQPVNLYVLGFFELLRVYNLEKVAVVWPDRISREAVEIGFESGYRLGLKTVFMESIPKGTLRLEPLAHRIKESGAQVLMVAGHFNESVNMRKALKNINWYPRAYYAIGGPLHQDYYKQLGKSAEYSFCSIQWKYYDKMPFPGSRKFYEAFVEAYKVEPTHASAAAYASCVILKTAVEKVGDTDPEKLRDMLSRMDIMTLLGRYKVDRNGMQSRNIALTIQLINGKQEIVWPESMQTAKPVIK